MSRLVLLAVPSILAQALTLLSQNSNLAYQVPSHGSTKMLASTALVDGKIIQLCIDLFRLYTYIDCVDIYQLDTCTLALMTAKL